MKIFFKILFSWMGSLFPYIWLFLMLSFSILFANDNTRTNNNNIDFNFSFLREIEFDSISSTKGFFIDEVSYTFSDGFLGSMPKNNPHSPQSILTFSTLGISSITISQNTDNNQFGGSGNGNNVDYDVNVTFNLSSGSSFTLEATFSWREPSSGNIAIIGLEFKNNVNQSFTYGSSTYTIDGGTQANSTSLGLKIPGSSISFSDGQNRTGANSTAGILDWLNDNLSSPDTTAPSITSGITGTDLVENTGSGQTVYTITATDAVGVESYAIDGMDASLLSVNSSTGVVSLTADPDYETKSSYSFTVTASDAAGNTSASTTVTFSITDEDDTPPVVTSGITGTDLVENTGSGQTVYTITATDAVGVESYAIDGMDASLLSVNSSTGVVSLTADPDYETKSSYSFTVTASDAAGNTSASTTVTFSITDEDDTPPVVTSGITGTDLVENTGSGQTVYTITATDAVGVESYAIDGMDASLLSVNSSTGVVSLTADPDYETKSSYSFTVTASDAAGNTSASTTVTFSITDEDDTPPVVTSGITGTDLVENTGSGQTVYTITATDAVGVESYAIDGMDASLLSVNSSTGVVSLTADPDYETKSSYSFTVTASDAAGNTSASTTVTFSITDEDDTPPVVTSGITGTDLVENTGSGQTVYTITATDAVGVESYAIDGMDASLLSVNSSTGVVSLTADPDYETKSSYSFTVTASDAAGNTSASTTVTFSITDEDDTPPVVTSGITGTDLVENTGSGQTVYTITATDAVGVESYAIDGMDASLLSVNSSTGVVSLTADPDYETKSSYSFTVTASDAAGNTSASTTVTFSITDEDDTPPVVTSGITGTDLVENTGSGQTVYTITATDAVGVESYAIDGMDASLLSVNSSTGVVSLTADPDYETKSSYSFTVTASDAAGNTSASTTVTFSITDEDDTPPVVTSGITGTDLVENTGSGQTVYTITATDAVGVESYAIDGMDASLLSVNSSTGVVSLTADPDYETKSSYSFTVTASDAAGNTSASTTVTFSITDEDDTPPVVTSGITGTDLVENTGSGQTVYTITATDAVGVESYAIDGMDASLLSVNSSTGVVSLTADPDYETKSSYSFTVTASDAAGNTSASTTVTFSITDEDDTPPVVTSGITGTDLVENTGSGQTVYTITATDAVGVESYAIDGMDASLLSVNSSTGVVSLTADPDYETKSSYSFTVTASDAAGNTSASTTVTFSITDEDDTPPVVTSGITGTDLVENTGSGQTVYTITATDAVGVESYAIDGMDASLLSVNSSTGVVSLTADPDYETKSSYSFTVTASDAAGNTSASTTVTFSITDEDDTPPVVTSGITGTDLVENTGSGQTVYTITATDAVGVESYAIDGMDASLLSVNSSTGVVSLTADPDYETKSSYSFTVTASDAAGNTSASTTVTFSITDEDDTPPVVTSGITGTDLVENTGSGQTVYTITATDAVGVESYAIDGMDASLLSVNSSTGVVSLTADPDYETKSSYSFTVTASDAAGNTSASTTVTFSITDEDDTPPVVTSGITGTDLVENTGSGQTVYTITATDAVGVESYAIDGMDASLLSVNSSTGVVSLTADPDYETKSSYSFTVTASDAAGNTSASTTVTFSITDEDDTPPVVTSGITGTDLVENTGSGQTVYTITATDAVGVESYAIDGMDASLLSVNSSTGVVSLTADPDYETKSSYSFTVTASDAAGNTSASTTVTFSITDEDDTPPVVTSGITGTDLVENTGSGQTVYTITATDAVGVESYAIDGMDASLLSVNSSTGVVSLTADPDYETKSSYSFTVTASDAAGNTSASTTVTFSITDEDDTPPVVTSGITGTDLVENTGSGQTVYTITATDAVGVESYAIDGMDASLLSVNSSTGVVSLTADPDYETKSSYSFTVTASDAAGNTSASTTVTFSITDEDDTPPVVTSGITGTDLVENTGSGQTVYTITATDAVGVESYAIDGMDASLLSVNSSTGVVSLTADPDYETKSSYSFTVTASDAAGNTSASTTVTFSITDEDDTPPVVTSGITGTDLVENTGSGQTVYTITATDAVGVESYAIDGMDASLLSVNSSTGVVSLTADPDYETKSSYSFTVTASDAAGNTSASTTVTFSITDEDDTPPVVTSGITGTDLVENTGSGQTVYTITATDAVGVESYAIDGMDASLLSVNSSTGVVSLTADPDYETKSSYSFTVTASDAAGNTSASTTVTFSITDEDDTPPVVTSGITGTDLVENTGSGQTVYTITATDAVGVESYAIDGMDASLLSVNSSTGVVSLTADPDYETKSSYSFTVTASDAAGNTSASTTVTFSITDEDDTPPVVTSGITGTDLVENTGSGQTVYTITATDAVGVESYAIDGMDASLLSVNSSTGVVSLTADPDYETKSSYSFTVTASDAAGNTSASTTVTFSITDEDDTPPVVTSGITGTDLVENTGSGQTVYTITATDAVGVESYAIDGMDASLLSVNSSTGVVSLTADPDYETKSSYSFTVTASDAAGNTSASTTVTFSITDEDDTPPVVTSGITGTDLVENTGSGQTVYTITATDAVGVESYAIDGMDASLLSVNSSTGVVSLTADPDYETKSSYSFTVTASDAAGNTSASTTVTFSITDEDDTPPVVTSGITGTDLVENTGSGQTVYTITATDAVGVESYAIDGMDASLLSVNSSTGVVSLTADPDYETKSSYSFTVTASDAAGNTSASTTVTFSITDEDDTPPVVTSGITGTDLVENTGSGQTVYTITATDAVGVESYAIDGMDASLLSVNSSTGVVSLTADPDYETKSSYSFTVTASDAAGNTSASTTVTFSITDEDDTPPVVTSGITGTDLVENTGSGQTVYTITATDAVGVESYAIDGMDASLLSVNSSTGVVSLTADPDYETKSSYSFTVTASDAAGNTSASTTVTFSITDEDDTPPVVTSGITGTDLVENTGSGQTVYTITATDAVGVESYAIDGMDASLLSVNSSTGVVSLTADPDYETKSSYSFTVTASDAAGNTSASTTVTFSITDVDEIHL
jgi:hypothetical protein